MKHIRYIILALVIGVSIAARGDEKKSITDPYISRMEKLALAYEATDNLEERKRLLNEMYTLDEEMIDQSIKDVDKQFKEGKASASDFRRIGFAMKAARQPKAADWYLYRGARLGDADCLNYVLVKEITTKQDPTVVTGILEWIKDSFNPPLLHNLALILCKFGNSKLDAIARQWGEEYFKWMVTSKSYDLDKYIDYNDNPELQALNKTWTKPSSRRQIGRKLREFLDRPAK